jgi:hypothetical protein
VSSEEPHGCPSEIVRFEYAGAYPSAKGSSKTRLGGVLAFACDSSFDPTSEPLPPRIAEAMGAIVGTTAVVATEGHLTGYRTS